MSGFLSQKYLDTRHPELFHLGAMVMHYLVAVCRSNLEGVDEQWADAKVKRVEVTGIGFTLYFAVDRSNRAITSKVPLPFDRVRLIIDDEEVPVCVALFLDEGFLEALEVFDLAGNTERFGERFRFETIAFRLQET